MLEPNYPVTFFGLNPGGSKWIKPAISNENGSSYLVENWIGKEGKEGKAPLQKKIQALYTVIASSFSYEVSCNDLLKYSLATNFVPFRSGSWNDLNGKRKSALEFSRNIWSERISQVPSSLYVTMSKVSFKEIDGILKEQGYSATNSVSPLVGWGRVKYQIVEYKSNNHQTAVIRLPHLSIYKIFGRAKSQDAIDHLAVICKKYLG
tara:strand:- start:1522 stop:2139 length:618 start_codon:yes stop_codon:yes gene_type:complete